MGGRKHAFQKGLPLGKDLSGIQDPFERHTALFSNYQLPFCKYCGKEILDSPSDEHNRPVDFEFEAQIEAHYACYINNQKAPKPIEPQKSLEEIIKEQYGLDTKKIGEE